MQCILYYNSYIILYMSNGCVIMIVKNVFHCLLYQYNTATRCLLKGDLEMCIYIQLTMSWTEAHFCTTLENFKGIIIIIIMLIIIECRVSRQWS